MAKFAVERETPSDILVRESLAQLLRSLFDAATAGLLTTSEYVA